MTGFRHADPPNIRPLVGRRDADALIACLSDPNPCTRNRAMLVLARLGATALEPLLRALGDDDPRVKMGASRALQLMGRPAIKSLSSLLQSQDEACRTDAALTLAHMRSPDAIDSIVTAVRDGILGEHYLDPLMECATGWRGVTDWYAWWNERRDDWRFAGIQADHYIVRIQPPGPADIPRAIHEVLAARAYIHGAATVDFHLDAGMDDIYMLGLGLRHAEWSHRRVDPQRSALHDLSGRVVGKLYALFLQRKSD